MKTRSIKKALPRLARTTILLLIALILRPISGRSFTPSIRTSGKILLSCSAS